MTRVCLISSAWARKNVAAISAHFKLSSNVSSDRKPNGKSQITKERPGCVNDTGLLNIIRMGSKKRCGYLRSLQIILQCILRSETKWEIPDYERKTWLCK